MIGRPGWVRPRLPSVLTLAAAAHADAVDAVAVYEPALPPLLDEQARAPYGEAFASMGELAAEGKLTEAMRVFAVPFNDDELTVADNAGYLEAAGRYVPNLLSTIQQQPECRGPPPMIQPCSARSRHRCWCWREWTPSPSWPAACGTGPTTSSTRGYRRSPVPGTPLADASRGARRGTPRVLLTSQAAGLTRHEPIGATRRDGHDAQPAANAGAHSQPPGPCVRLRSVWRRSVMVSYGCGPAGQGPQSEWSPTSG